MHHIELILSIWTVTILANNPHTRNRAPTLLFIPFLSLSLPLRRPRPVAWSAHALASFHALPCFSVAWPPFALSGHVHAVFQPWLCESMQAQGQWSAMRDVAMDVTYMLDKCTLVLEGITLAEMV